MRPIAFALGSNLGDRQGYLQAAADQLSEDVVVQARVSSVFETAPWGGIEQGPFFNAVLLGESDWEPPAILNYIKLLERSLGRQARVQNGPREIDIDLLYWGDRSWDAEGLRVPHPGIADRLFVLEPLAEVEPDWVHPTLKVSVKELLHRLRPQSKLPSAKVVATLRLGKETP